MRHLITLGLLLWLAPSVWASAGPMDDKELEAAAGLIAHGQITEVLCAGLPEVDEVKTYTPYLATLTIDEVQKGEELTTVTLPFATVVYAPDASLPKCGWVPEYREGDKGLYYLQTDESAEIYTLVAENAFVPDGDSAGLELPVCEASAADAGPSGDVGEPAAAEDVAAPGPTPEVTESDAEGSDAASDPAQDAPDLPECEEDSDCSEGQRCMLVNTPNGELWQCSEPECETSADCGGSCNSCDMGRCNYAPHCPECFSDSDCAEGQECYWFNGDSDAYCRDSGSDGGGCAGGGSKAPLGLVLALLGAVAWGRRRQVG